MVAAADRGEYARRKGRIGVEGAMGRGARVRDFILGRVGRIRGRHTRALTRGVHRRVRSGGCRGCRHSCVVPPTLVVLAFTVRDQGRESGFVSKDFGEKFWLRLLDGGANVCVCGDEDEETLARMDAEARARTEAAEEGDLLVLGAVAKRSK